MNRVEKYRNHEFITTNHAFERFYLSERLPAEKEEYYADEINRIMRDVLDIAIKDNYENCSILVHSKSTSIGLILSFYKQQRKLKIVTILPIKSNHDSKDIDDVILLVEQEVMSKVSNKLRESISTEGAVHKVGIFDNTITAILFEGILYDLDCEILIVK